MIFLLLVQMVIWESKPIPPVLHAGHWDSCGDERILEHYEHGKFVWEMHFGPSDEFALYDHPVDGPDHKHNLADNLLGPAYYFRAFTTQTGRHWTIPGLKLWIGINEGGGNCEGFFVRIERKEPKR